MKFTNHFYRARFVINYNLARAYGPGVLNPMQIDGITLYKYNNGI